MIHGANCNCKECESALSHKIESSFKDAEFAKRFTELTGGKWHEVTVKEGQLTKCSCGQTGCIARIECEKNNPTYSNAADILRVMEERKDYYDFIEKIVKSINYTIPLNVLAYFINDYILNPTALLREAVEFLEQIKGEGK